VSPEDLQALWVPAVAHRLVVANAAAGDASRQAQALLDATPVP
jgi:hypothetical protein